MKMIGKRILICLLVVVTMLASVPMSGFVGLELPKLSQLFAVKASAATEYKSGYYTYTVSGGKATITDVDDSISGSVTIPSKLGGYPVTEIGGSTAGDDTFDGDAGEVKGGFSNCKKMTQIAIPSTITKIGHTAFFGCTSLTRVNISSIEAWLKIEFVVDDMSISANPLYHAGKLYLNGNPVTDLIVPTTVTTIKDCAFYNCKTIKNVKFHNSLKTIGYDAFAGCTSLKEVIIPDSAVLYDEAFAACTSLENVVLSNRMNTVYRGTFAFCGNLKSITIPAGIKTIGWTAFNGCDNLKTIHYKGTRSDWAEVNIEEYNEAILNADINFTESGSKLKLTAEQAVNVFMRYEDVWKEKEKIQDYWNYPYYGFLDLDFDGVLELVRTVNQGSGYYEYTSFYRIDSADMRVKPIEYHQDGYYSEFAIDSILGLSDDFKIIQNKVTGEKMYFGYDNWKVSASNAGFDYGILCNKNGKVYQYPVYGWYVDYDEAHSDETYYCTYDSKHNPKKVTKQKYDDTVKEFWKNNTDLNGKCSSVAAKTYHEASTQEQKRQYLLESYCAFSYDGYVAQFGNYEIDIYSALPAMILGEGMSMGMSAQLKKDDKVVCNDFNFSVASSNPKVVEITKTETVNEGVKFVVKANKTGIATITVTDKKTRTKSSEKIRVDSGTLTFSAVDMPEYYDKTNKYNGYVNGMFIADYQCVRDDKNYFDISFDVYNSTYTVGIAEVYDAKGKLIDAKPIERMKNSSTSLSETFLSAYYLAEDCFTDDLLTFKQNSYTKKTGKDFLKFKVPEGGYIKITNDTSTSKNCSLINNTSFIADMLLTISGAISNINKKDAVLETLNKEAVKTIVLGMSAEIKDKIFSEIKSTLISDVTVESINNCIITFANKGLQVYKANGFNIESMVNKCAESVGVGSVEGFITKALGPYGQVIEELFFFANLVDLTSWFLSLGQTSNSKNTVLCIYANKCDVHSYSKVITIDKKATVKSDGSKSYHCRRCGEKKNVTVIPKIVVKLLRSDYVFDNKNKTQELQLSVSDRKGKKLINGTDYEVSSRNRAIGKAEATIMLIGKEYSGSTTISFNIVPPATSKVAVSQTTSSIKVAWKAVSGVTGYKVYLYKGSKLVKTVEQKNTSCTFTSLSAGTIYKVYVKAYKTVNGQKFWSASRSISTATKPGTPSLSVTAGAKKATLKWNKQTGATGYVVYMSTSKSGKYSRIATLKSNSAISYTKTGLTKGKTYYFKVAAYVTVSGKNIYSDFSTVKYIRAK